LFEGWRYLPIGEEGHEVAVGVNPLTPAVMRGSSPMGSNIPQSDYIGELPQGSYSYYLRTLGIS